MQESESLRNKLNTIIFGTDTKAGKLFDEWLIIAILVSVFVLMLDSVEHVSAQFGRFLYIAEWAFTLLFTIEYFARIYCAPKRLAYTFSFYGIIDLVAILPSYLSLVFPGMSYLLIIRLLRVLRVFRVLKLIRYVQEANSLLAAMYASRRKILVFFFFVITLAVIFGSLMYLVEGPGNGFTSIPKSIYWTIVTITTVGYGDITPHTSLGQIIASFAMLTGYSIIAVPTGIFTAELAHELQRERNKIVCENCGQVSHEKQANFCYVCGSVVKAHRSPS